VQERGDESPGAPPAGASCRPAPVRAPGRVHADRV